MKTRFERLALAGVLAFGLLTVGAKETSAQQQAGVRSGQQSRIYMMRGLLGIFSLGIDSLAAKLRAQGYDPQILGWDPWG